MLRRLIAGLVVGTGLILAACQPSATIPPAPAVPAALPLGDTQPQAANPQSPSTNRPAPAQGQALQPTPAGPTATPAPGFLQGSEQARGQVPVAPKSPNSPQTEIKPTSQPEPVKAQGPTTVSKDKMVFIQGGRLWLVSADGKERKALLEDTVPQLWSPPKDPGRAWLSPSARHIAYLAGPQAGVWLSGVQGPNTHVLVDKGLPADGVMADKEYEKLGRKLVDQEMAWSADESQLAFIAAPTGQADLYVARVADGKVAPITNDAVTHSELTWSPKGDMLGFKSRDEAGGLERVYVLRGDQLIQVPTDQIAKLADETDLGGAVNLTWLDDRRLAFFPMTSNLRSLGIWVFDISDNSLSQIYAQTLTSPNYHAATRRWVFLSADAKGTLQMLDTGTNQVKTILPEGVGSPIWTPDGKRIVYSRDNGTTYDIHIVNVDGTGDKLLAPNIMLIGENPPEPSPAGKRYFAPDGQRLIYAAVGSDFGSTGDNLENWWSVPLDGSKAPTPLTDIPRVFYIRQLSFAPDGQSFGFVGLRYSDRSTHLWTVSPYGGNLVKVDAEVRWFRWLGPSSAIQSGK